MAGLTSRSVPIKLHGAPVFVINGEVFPGAMPQDEPEAIVAQCAHA